MDAPSNSGRRISTGLFEVDLTIGQIFRHGRRVPLQEQPFRVLAVLLEHPGQVVTREKLQARLWPADTYVGFDEGLNTAIRKLRVLFGDSADNPRFIETIPRCGYRFIAPVSELRNGFVLPDPQMEKAEPNEVSVAAAPAARPDTGKKDEPTVPAPPSLSPRRRTWVWMLSISVVAILVFGVARVIRRTHAPSSPETLPAKREMLAVLPFQNLSNDPAEEYFSDGLTEETITDLGQLSPDQLGVIARTSVMAYKHTDKTVSQIGHELGVDYILEGSVRRQQGRARISAQLIRVSDQTHLWARNYDDRGLRDFLDVQNEIGRAIAEQVQVNITPQRQLEMSRIHAVNPEALDLYLKGRFYWNQRTAAAIRDSILFFRKAVAADPGFALAYAGLADAYNISNLVGLYSSKESLPEARAAATTAILLDPSLAEAHAALGMEKSHYDFDLQGARAEFLKAIELNPNSAYAHLFYSNCYLMPMGQRTEAIEENKKALELDPLSMPINNFLGETYLLAGNYSQSYKQFQHTIAMDPNYGIARLYFAGLLEVMGRFEDALNEYERGQLLVGFTQKQASERAAALRKALKNGGEKEYWKEHLTQDLHEMEKPGAGLAISSVAEDYALAGEKDEAFEWLEKSYEAREGGELTLLAVDPVWKNLHGDPRFSDLLRRIGLPESSQNVADQPVRTNAH